VDGKTDPTRIDLAQKALLKGQLALEQAGTTPLMMAAYRGDDDALLELLAVHRETKSKLDNLIEARLVERSHEERGSKEVKTREGAAKVNYEIAMAPLNEIYRTGAHVLRALKPKIKELEKIQSELQAGIDEAHRKVLAHGDKENVSSALYEVKKRGLQSVLTSTDSSHARPDGFTALTIATKRKHHGSVRLLAASKADIDTIITNLWVTPLWAMCWQGDLPTVEACIEAKANLNWQDLRGSSPLIVAAQQGHVDCVAALLEAKADVTVEDDGGRCPLWRACYRGNAEVVEYFITNGMSVEKEKAEAAAAEQDVEVARHDLRKAEGRRDAFVVALRAKDQEVKAKIAAVEKVRRGPARDQARKDVEVAKEAAASASDSLEMCDQAIKDAKLEVNWRLTCAEKELKESVEASRRVNSPDYHGMTTSYVAAEKGHCDALALIIKARADVDQVTTEVHGQVTPMSIAARNGRDECVLQLYNAKGDPNQKCGGGHTPVMYACLYGHISTLLALLYIKELDKQHNPNKPCDTSCLA